jgi:hypothetical protein
VGTIKHSVSDTIPVGASLLANASVGTPQAPSLKRRCRSVDRYGDHQKILCQPTPQWLKPDRGSLSVASFGQVDFRHQQFGLSVEYFNGEFQGST